MPTTKKPSPKQRVESDLRRNLPSSAAHVSCLAKEQRLHCGESELCMDDRASRGPVHTGRPCSSNPNAMCFFIAYMCMHAVSVSVWVCAYVCTSVQEYDHIPVEMAIRIPFGCLSGSIGTQPLKTVGVTVYVHILEMSPAR